MNRHTFLGFLCVLTASVLALIGQGTSGEGGGGTGTVKPNYLVPTDTNNYPSRTEVANGTNAAIVDATNQAAIFTRGYVPTNNAIYLATVTNVQAGANVTVDLTNPKAPIIASTASGGGATSTNTGYMLRLKGYAAFGSSDTAVARFANTITNTFPAEHLTYVTNAANGGVITILKRGYYVLAGNWTSSSGGAGQFGVSLNTAAGDLTNVPSNCNQTNLLCHSQIGAIASSGESPTASWAGTLVSNDVIRIHASDVPYNSELPKFNLSQSWYGE